MAKKNIKLISIIVAIVVLIIGFTCYYIYEVNYTTRGVINKYINKFEGKTLNEDFDTKIKSGNLATDYTVEQAIEDIDKLELDTINLPIVVNIDNINSSDMEIYDNSLQRAKWLLDKLHGTGINIILEPYPWIANGSEYETKLDPIDKQKFFDNWKTKVLKPLIDEIAIPYHVDVLNIATSFSKIEDMEDEFCHMIDYARQYYKGLITYRTSFWITTNWNNPKTKNIEESLKLQYEKKLNNKLFSKLDFISIAAYFELTDNDTNTVENLVRAIDSSQRYNRKQPIKSEIKAFHEKWGVPVFFGELGFPRTDKASIEPWNPYQTTKINNNEQANCFEAYRLSFENEPWLLGFSVFAIGDNHIDKLYYPGEKAIQSIKKWYK